MCSVVSIKFHSIDIVGSIYRHSGDLLLVALSASGAEHCDYARADLKGQAERAPGQEDGGSGQERQPDVHRY